MNKNQFRRTFFLSILAAALALAGCGGGNDAPQPVAKSDPFHEFQWHLKNIGQPAFAAEGGIAGIDLNVEELFKAGHRGSGVKVLVLDEGVDIRHEDLAANIDRDMLRNFERNAPDENDPTPLGIDDAHGTSVAGIIAAVANNDLGGRGVAPQASLGSVNFLCPGCVTIPNMVAAYGNDSYSGNAWVINASFGTTATAPEARDVDTDPVLLAIRGFTGMRAGKGIVMVKSSGNDFDGFKGENRDEPNSYCGPARQHKLSCLNAALDPANAMPQVVTVGAVNARGVKSSYSTAGSSLLVAGLGGEYGNGQLTDHPEAGPAIVTTDLSGCTRGYARHDNAPYRNLFVDPSSYLAKQLNPDCNYNSVMNGTSSAAPTVTGVVALMLEANPNLTWRDLRLILMKTARQADANIAPNTLKLAGGDYIAEPAWTTNAAGLKFHNWYGFGLVDAAAAVAMAKSATAHLSGPIADSGWRDASPDPDGLELDVPLADPNGASSSITLPTVVKRTIEAVQVRVMIAGGGRLGDLGIELISPKGTRSVLLNAHNVLQKSQRAEALLLLSNAFNEEEAGGNWTLRIVDVNGREASDPTQQAILANWSLRVYGR